MERAPFAVALAVVFAQAGTALNLGWAWAFFAVTLTIAECALIASAIVRLDAVIPFRH